MESDQDIFIPITSSPGTGIAIYENVWSDTSRTVNIIERVTSDKDSGVTYNLSTILGDVNNESNIKNQYRTSDDLHITGSSHNKHFADIDAECKKIIDTYLKSYKKDFNIHDDVFGPEGFQLLKYESGSYFKSHYDSYPAVKRCISVLIYLNDDYEGGEIEFVHFNAKIKPKAGSLILFPSNYPYRHIAHPVTSGTKYAIVTWLHER